MNAGGIALIGAAAVVFFARRGRVRAAAGFAPAEPPLPLPLPTAATGAPRCGAWYASRRSDLLLGTGPRSITARALFSFASDREKHDAKTWGNDTTRRIILARAIIEAPQNRAFLCPARGRQLATAAGETLDTRRAPLIWIPRMVEKNGVLTSA